MLIRALCDYYDVLEERGVFDDPAFSQVGIHYIIELTPEGKLAGLIDCQITDTTAKKPKPQARQMRFPKRTEKPGIESNFIEHRATYIFGLQYDKEAQRLTATDRTDKGKKSHEAFKSYHLEMLKNLDTPLIHAFRNFVNTWEPEQEEGNELLKSIEKKLGSLYFAFCLAGAPDRLLNTAPEIENRWKSTWSAGSDEEVNYAQCAILGSKEPIARTHFKIIGIPGGQSYGTRLISFNNTAEESYGQSQSMNSNVSETAMDHYTKALKYLLSTSKHRSFIDETTVIYWAASGNEACDDWFNSMMLESGEDETNMMLETLFDGVRNGALTIDIDGVDTDTEFYIVGIKPNASRLSVKFIYRNQFGRIVANLLRHAQDMQLGDKLKPVPLWQIKRALVSPKSSNEKSSNKKNSNEKNSNEKSSNEKCNPALIAKLFAAIVDGTTYPSALLSILIQRIRIDEVKDLKARNSLEIRMGLLKACINRTNRTKGLKEELTMALNPSNNTPSYLCGRLFAVLESIQQRSANFKLNRTIRNTYFSSASVRPAVIFPKLLSLAQHHIDKLDNSYYADQEIMEIMNQMGGCFPDTLSLSEQGVFMLGYYQQKAFTEAKIRKYREENKQ